MDIWVHGLGVVVGGRARGAGAIYPRVWLAAPLLRAGGLLKYGTSEGFRSRFGAGSGVWPEASKETQIKVPVLESYKYYEHKE